MVEILVLKELPLAMKKPLKPVIKRSIRAEGRVTDRLVKNTVYPQPQ